MATDLIIKLPDELLAELRNKAVAEGKSVDQLAEQAVRRMLEHQALDSLIERGKGHAARLGRRDAVKAVHDVRRGR